MGADLPTRIVDHQHRHGQLRAEPLGAVAGETFETRLRASSVRRKTLRSGWARTSASVAWAARLGKGFAQDRRGSALAWRAPGQDMGGKRAVDHPVARRGRRSAHGQAAAPRKPAARDQQEHLARAEAARLPCRNRRARRAQPFEIAAIGRERQINVEDPRLVELRFELVGAKNLPRLGEEIRSGRAPAAGPPAWLGSSRRKWRGRGGYIARRQRAPKAP